MNPIQNIKKRKNWVFFLIIALILIFLFNSKFSSQSVISPPPQSTCDQCGIGLDLCSVDDCLNLGCVIDNSDISNYFYNTCKSCIENGVSINAKQYFMDHQLFIDYPNIYPDKMCCSGATKKVTSLIGGTIYYTCVDASIGCGNSFERTIADIGAYITKGDTVACKTKFMAGLGIIGFAAILLITII